MRELLVSEKRCIRNLLIAERGLDICLEELRVAAEHFAPPRVRRKGSRVNNDFLLKFVNLTRSTHDYNSVGTPILPNTIGADIFVVLERGTCELLMLHLIAGEAFPIKNP